LGLPAPHVRVERNAAGDYNGRHAYKLARGVRSVDLEMVGWPLDRVRLAPDSNAWNFPRLYVDGNSGLWPCALNMVKNALLDHDGSAERGYLQSKADVAFVIANEPRCPMC